MLLLVLRQSTASFKPFRLQISSPNFDVQANPGVPIQTTNRYLSLLGAEDKSFTVVSDDEISSCGEMVCGICKNYEGEEGEECVECHSNTSSITFSNDYLYGVCGGRSFTKSGFVPNESAGIEKCKTNESDVSSEVELGTNSTGEGPEPLPVRWTNCYKKDDTRRYFKVGVLLTSTVGVDVSKVSVRR